MKTTSSIIARFQASIKPSDAPVVIPPFTPEVAIGSSVKKAWAQDVIKRVSSRVAQLDNIVQSVNLSQDGMRRYVEAREKLAGQSDANFWVRSRDIAPEKLLVESMQVADQSILMSAIEAEQAAIEEASVRDRNAGFAALRSRVERLLGEDTASSAAVYLSESASNPFSQHSLPVSLLVQRVYGGDLLLTDTGEYANLLPDGLALNLSEVDLKVNSQWRIAPARITTNAKAAMLWRRYEAMLRDPSFADRVYLSEGPSDALAWERGSTMRQGTEEEFQGMKLRRGPDGHVYIRDSLPLNQIEPTEKTLQIDGEVHDPEQLERYRHQILDDGVDEIDPLIVSAKQVDRKGDPYHYLRDGHHRFSAAGSLEADHVPVWREITPHGLRHEQGEVAVLAEQAAREALPVTGKPWKFQYMRNPAKSPFMGETYGQHVEPAGRYMTTASDKPPQGWETGEHEFSNPLVIHWGPDEGYSHPANWKNKLSAQFGGKRGVHLSIAIVNAGHDGVVTTRNGDTSEIVDLKPIASSSLKMAEPIPGESVAGDYTTTPPRTDAPRMSLGDLSALPGTHPIPEGMERRYHVSSASPDVLRNQGLRMANARGIEGPKAIYSWPEYKQAKDYAGQLPVVEFWERPEAHRDHPYAQLTDVHPNQIVAIHEPWHDHARYMAENGDAGMLDFAKTLGGHHAQAVDYLLSKNPHLQPSSSLTMAEPIPGLHEWHAGSHPSTKNEDGTPKTFYHASMNSIHTFDPKARDKEAKAKNSSTQAKASFFAQNSGTAEHFLYGTAREGAQVTPVHIHAKNPWDYENPEHVSAMAEPVKSWMGRVGFLADHATAMRFLASGDYSMIESPELQRAIKKRKHDAFFVGEEGKNIGIYRPEQVKSALTNSGGYDPTNPRIDMSESGCLVVVMDGDEPLPVVKLGSDQPQLPNTQVPWNHVPDKTVYHGTPHEPFDKFDLRKAGKSTRTPGDFGKGLYFTPSYDEAKGYSHRGDSVYSPLGHVAEATLSIKNPFVIDHEQEHDFPSRLRDLGFSERDVNLSRTSGPRDFIQHFGPKEFRDHLAKKGHDGIIIHKANGSPDEHVVFSPSQINVHRWIDASTNYSVMASETNWGNRLSLSAAEAEYECLDLAELDDVISEGMSRHSPRFASKSFNSLPKAAFDKLSGAMASRNKSAEPWRDAAFSVHANEIAHVNNRHGVGREMDYEGVEVQPHHMRLIPHVMVNPDKVTYSRQHEAGHHSVIFERNFPKVGRAHVVVHLSPQDDGGQIKFKTMWIKGAHGVLLGEIPSAEMPRNRRGVRYEEDRDTNILLAEPKGGFRGGVPFVLDSARKWVESQGRQYEPYHEYEPLDEEWAKNTADHLDSLKHDPHNPDVQRSYGQLKRDIVSQYDHIQNHDGVSLTPWPHTDSQPYQSSDEMIADIANNRRLHFFTGGDMPADHPMAEKHENGLTFNDMFRAVHDYYGHAKRGLQFGPRGEENAWIQHSRMFHPDAVPAMSAETKGQNNWVNFGAHMRRQDGSLPKKGDHDWTHPADRPYAEQRAAILGPEFADPERYRRGRTQAVPEAAKPGAINKPGEINKPELPSTPATP